MKNETSCCVGHVIGTRITKPPQLGTMAPLPGAAGRLMLLVLYAAGFYWAGKMAYAIRIYAIKNYGYVIHEFDPWFNYRATEVRPGLRRHDAAPTAP